MCGKCNHNHCRGRYLKIGIFVIIGIAVLSLVVMLLWNWLMPALFSGAHAIGYLQALGLLILARVLFGGMRGHGCHRHRHPLGRWWDNMSPEERKNFRQRWHHMSAEERKKFRADMCGCGKGEAPAEGDTEKTD